MQTAKVCGDGECKFAHCTTAFEGLCVDDSAATATLDAACLVSFARVIYGRLRSGCSDSSEGCRKVPLILGAESLSVVNSNIF